MASKIAALLVAFWFGWASSALAQQAVPLSSFPAGSDEGTGDPDAVALQCFSVNTNKIMASEGSSANLSIKNSCAFDIYVALCAPINAPRSFLCKTDGPDVSAVVWRLKARTDTQTSVPDDMILAHMVCRVPARPVMASRTQGKCVKP